MNFFVLIDVDRVYLYNTATYTTTGAVSITHTSTLLLLIVP